MSPVNEVSEKKSSLSLTLKHKVPFLLKMNWLRDQLISSASWSGARKWEKCFYDTFAICLHIDTSK